jgi:transglutaminase-like putative cysteine protease
MTPRPHDGQHISHWRIETDVDGRLRQGEDPFGNITHTLAIDGPVQRVRLMVSGEVDTFDTGGVVRGLVDRFPADVFLRETPLSALDRDMRDYAEAVMLSEGEPLSQLHALLGALHRDVRFCTGTTDARGTGIEAFRQKSGVCQDLAHIFIGMARWVGIPARYVSGHLVRHDGAIEQDAAHAWGEAFIPGLGWVGFDPANGMCPTDGYVRIATALDYLGAAPVRGHRYGGGNEQMNVFLTVAADPDSQEQ